MRNQNLLYEDGKLRIVWEVEDDPDADYSWLGSFSRYEETKGAFRVNKEYYPERYFIPDNGSSELEERKAYAKLGCSRHEAYLKARKCMIEQADMLDRLYKGYWGFVGVIVTVFWGDRALGDYSIWGVDTIGGNDHFVDTANEIALDAIRDAEVHLHDLDVPTDKAVWQKIEGAISHVKKGFEGYSHSRENLKRNLENWRKDKRYLSAFNKQRAVIFS